MPPRPPSLCRHVRCITRPERHLKGSASGERSPHPVQDRGDPCPSLHSPFHFHTNAMLLRESIYFRLIYRRGEVKLLFF